MKATDTTFNILKHDIVNVVISPVRRGGVCNWWYNCVCMGKDLQEVVVVFYKLYFLSVVRGELDRFRL